MHHHHSPIIYLARLGTKWLVAALILFVLFNPITWGAGLAIYDALTGGQSGAWLIDGAPQPAQPVKRASMVFESCFQPRQLPPGNPYCWTTPPSPIASENYCQLHIKGFTFVVPTDCSRVTFPGAKKGT